MNTPHSLIQCFATSQFVRECVIIWLGFILGHTSKLRLIYLKIWPHLKRISFNSANKSVIKLNSWWNRKITIDSHVCPKKKTNHSLFQILKCEAEEKKTNITPYTRFGRNFFLDEEKNKNKISTKKKRHRLECVETIPRDENEEIFYVCMCMCMPWHCNIFLSSYHWNKMYINI